MSTSYPEEPEDDIYRVYLPEWVTVFTTLTREAVNAHFDAQYAGRVQRKHVRVVDDYRRFHLQLWLPTLKGEFSGRGRAMACKADLDKHPTVATWKNRVSVVRRNSLADHALRNYGIKMLPADHPDGGDPDGG